MNSANRDDLDEEKLSNLGEGPIDSETGTSDAIPTARAERRREQMMRTTSDDLPFGGEPLVSARIWMLVAAAILLALAIPLFYVFFGLGTATVVNGGWYTFAFVTGLAVLVIVGGGIFAYTRARLRKSPRDDAGNVLRIERPERFSGDDDEERVLPRHERPGLTLDVRSIMRPDPVICGTLDSIYDCAKDMYAHNVGFLVVLDAEDHCVGVITDRDLVCGGLAEGFDPKSTPITGIMEPELKSVTPDHTVEDCLRVMQNDGIRRVPVLEQGQLVGIVTLDDLILKRLCSIDDVAIVVKRQLAEPGIDHGLNERQLGQHKVDVA